MTFGQLDMANYPLLITAYLLRSTPKFLFHLLLIFGIFIVLLYALYNYKRFRFQLRRSKSLLLKYPYPCTHFCMMVIRSWQSNLYKVPPFVHTFIYLSWSDGPAPSVPTPLLSGALTIESIIPSTVLSLQSFL